MARKRVILELGTGNDLHGGDYTKAALRAVQDALHHSSLTMLRTLEVNPKTGMFVDVTIGVQQPDKVDVEKVRASLPHGIVTVKVVKGGLDVPDPENNDPAVIASRRGRGPAGAAVMLLYEHPLSSYAQKVKIALREKGLDFEMETPPALGSGKADGAFAAASPRNEVPALIDGDAQHLRFDHHPRISRGQVPLPALLPRDPAARAQARMIEDVCDTLYEAVNWGLSEIRWFKRAEGEQAEKMKATAARQTAELQAWLTGKLGNGRVVQRRQLRLGRPQRRALRQPLVPLRLGHARRVAAGELARAHPRASRRSPRPSASSRRRPSAWATPPRACASGAIRREYRDHRLEWMMKSGGVQVVLDGLAKNNIRFTWPLG